VRCRREVETRRVDLETRFDLVLVEVIVWVENIVEVSLGLDRLAEVHWARPRLFGLARFATGLKTSLKQRLALGTFSKKYQNELMSACSRQDRQLPGHGCAAGCIHANFADLLCGNGSGTHVIFNAKVWFWTPQEHSKARFFHIIIFCFQINTLVKREDSFENPSS
jgi:hypothetical protein